MYETAFIKSERKDDYNILTLAIPYIHEFNDKLKKLSPLMFTKVLQVSMNVLETVETYSNNKSYIDYKDILDEELEKIKKEYSDWVDQVSEECDWKTSITMDEVQAVYSRIALKYALSIIENHLNMSYLDSFRMLGKKRDEIKKLLDEEV